MITMYPELDLDLGFHPVSCEQPEAFTQDQIDQYNEVGYISPIRLFEGEELDELQAFFERSRKRLTSIGSFKSFHHEIPELYDIVANPRTTACLKDLLGPNVVCHVSQYIRKEPDPDSSRKTIYHQDATFNPMDARCALVWLAVDRAFVDNGCMWFVPGSHRQGVLECDEGHHIADAASIENQVPMELEPGQAVFFSDLLIHSSPPNRTADKVRGGLTATYASAELVPTLGQKKWAAMCCGEDEDNNWDVHEPPR
jgi:ectoine hydroxylase-related dioxygenase (phytanoyl-CoA dioxygenase family)